jgi:D-threonate/D-erythronate kinase
MKRILIIADDLTGAAEIGGIALHHGLTAEIHCGTFRKGDSNVLIIDTDTRHLPDAVAGRRIRHVLESVDPSEFDLIYKKTDSLLRGPVAAELSAAMEFLHLERALLVPQNPSRGRVIENGQYLIDGIPLGCSLVAADLEHPPTTADVSQLLDPSHQFNIQCFVPGHAVPAHGIAIGAGTSAADIGHWTTQLNPQTVPAGGADFFTSLLQSRGLSPIAPQSTKSDFKNALVIFGSASVPSRDYVRKISADGVAICAMPINLFDAMTPNHTSLSPWQEAILTQLGKAGYALLAVRHPIVPERAENVRRTISDLVAQILPLHPVETLFIEGGATAAAIIQRLSWTELSVESQLAQGIVALRPVAAPHPLLILKPGTYPWPPGLLPGV